MIPAHCADVGTRKLNIDLSEVNLRRHLIGTRSYTRSRFYAVTNGLDWSVIRVIKQPNRNLFQTVDDIEILSPPERTVFVQRPDIDVLNIGEILSVQSKYPDKLVVVQGRFEHLSFIDVRLPAKIGVIDVVPPKPSKLEVLIGDLLGKSGSMIDLNVKVIDIGDLIAKISGDRKVLLPCLASHSDSDELGREVQYLDQSPEISDDELDSVVLVGCSLSQRIFQEIYGPTPVLSSICPVDNAGIAGSDMPIIARCCKVKSGVERNEHLFLVPWGATLGEVSEALRFALSHR